MTRKTELLELAERVEAAKHPPEAWELLEEAWHLVAPLEQSDLAGFTRREASFWMFMDADAFLDAAMTLKPSGEGHWPQLIMTGTNPNNPSRQKERCEIWAKGYLKPFRGHAATPALALCAAALRAHAEMCDE